MNSFLRAFFNLCYPPSCAGCKSPVLRSEGLLCLQCQISLPINPHFGAKSNPVRSVFAGRLPVENAETLLLFSSHGITQNLIHALKYQGQQEVGKMLGTRLAMLYKSHYRDLPDYVLPMPLHPKKEKLRGYNQCIRMAESMAAIFGCKVAPPVVERVVQNPSQTKLNREKRWDNVAGIFRLNDTVIFTNKHVLLIDDTLTTGATLEALGMAILNTPGVKISIATLAIAT